MREFLGLPFQTKMISFDLKHLVLLFCLKGALQIKLN